jgi:hypothetical protein
MTPLPDVVHHARNFKAHVLEQPRTLLGHGLVRAVQRYLLVQRQAGGPSNRSGPA